MNDFDKFSALAGPTPKLTIPASLIAGLQHATLGGPLGPLEQRHIGETLVGRRDDYINLLNEKLHPIGLEAAADVCNPGDKLVGVVVRRRR